MALFISFNLHGFNPRHPLSVSIAAATSLLISLLNILVFRNMVFAAVKYAPSACSLVMMKGGESLAVHS